MTPWVERPFPMFLLVLLWCSFLHNISTFLIHNSYEKIIILNSYAFMLPIRIAMMFTCLCVFVSGFLRTNDLALSRDVLTKRKKLRLASSNYKFLQTTKSTWTWNVQRGERILLIGSVLSLYVVTLKVILYLLFTIQIAWNLCLSFLGFAEAKRVVVLVKHETGKSSDHKFIPHIVVLTLFLTSNLSILFCSLHPFSRVKIVDLLVWLRRSGFLRPTTSFNAPYTS